MSEDVPIEPARLMSKSQAAAHLGVSLPTFSKWVAADFIPGALPIRKWDRKALDAALDKMSGLKPEQSKTDAVEDAYEKWKREDNARRKPR